WCTDHAQTEANGSLKPCPYQEHYGYNDEFKHRLPFVTTTSTKSVFGVGGGNPNRRCRLYFLPLHHQVLSRRNAIELPSTSSMILSMSIVLRRGDQKSHDT